MIDETPDQAGTAEPERHRSFMMGLSAVVTLLVAAWCLADGPFLLDTSYLPWALLAVGIVVGVGLIASGFRRK
ncbi:hypothetical protein [Gordonia neofelifaecis]|uniref:Uncharacterized protein n=1 Tax=Gordonia neofelifaecis NRRL B-59395 TaxID=644548 RepID=F1YFT8_9ACTN|nr:hypothetical protein [Gordonia neofelifaecis]EGD56515.1 hypothetical protein SCNU_03152 [Gordonia neofelifaecis NRRL B-59395]